MHVNLSFIDVLFHFCLFGLLIHSMLGPIKQYLIPFLHKLVLHDKNNQLEIIERDKLLTSTRLRLQNQIKQQKKSFIDLEENVQLWYKATQEQVQREEQSERLRQQAIQARRLIQRKTIYTNDLINSALPKAIAHAEKEIIAIFKKKQNQFTKESIQQFLKIHSNREQS